MVEITSRWKLDHHGKPRSTSTKPPLNIIVQEERKRKEDYILFCPAISIFQFILDKLSFNLKDSNESIWKSIEERFGKPTEDFLQCVVETRKVKI